MKDPTIEAIRELLPGFYDPEPGKEKPGGICTPESGCAPAGEAPRNDILTLLTGTNPPPSAPPQRDRQNSQSGILDILTRAKASAQ